MDVAQRPNARNEHLTKLIQLTVLILEIVKDCAIPPPRSPLDGLIAAMKRVGFPPVRVGRSLANVSRT